MGYTRIYKQVMREYDEDRRQADLLLKKRREEVYEAIPQVKELDDLLMKNGLSIAKTILAGEGKNNSEIAGCQAKIDQLRKEKQKYLEAHNLNASYFTDIYKCNVCKDTGYIDAKKCKCLTQRLVEKYYNAANVSIIVETENFDTFDFRFYDAKLSEETGVSPLANIQMIYSNCMDFVTHFQASFQNLLFYGDTGLGKTFLCNCIAKDLLDAGSTVLYVTAPQIFKKIEEFRFHRNDMDSPDEQIEMIYEVDLLIIDDLGSEFSTVVTNTELFNIINTRILSRNHTIISTNLSLNDFQSHYSDRIVSRLFGNYKMMRFFGDDIRVKKMMKSLGKGKP